MSEPTEPRKEYLDDKGRYLPRMYDELVEEVRSKYDLREWLRRCRDKKLAPALQEEFDAEAARLEYDFNVPRAEAEQQASVTVFNNHNVL